MLDNISQSAKAIKAVYSGEVAYCKFLSANDTGDTGAHQTGVYITKNSAPALFNILGQKGENINKDIEIKWQDDFSTNSRIIYYGKGSRNEYRITRFDKGFPFLKPEHTGDLFVLIKMNEEQFIAYVLESEEEINEFLDAFGMSPADTGRIIQRDDISPKTQADLVIMQYINTVEVDFPASAVISEMARKIYRQVYDNEKNITADPDRAIVEWAEMEYTIFRQLELFQYSDMISKGFTTVDQFIKVANMILNRRKSRAGKSLEHHLSAIFDGNKLSYDSQPKTEGNKRPDFVFPGGNKYRDIDWPPDKLVFLGAKTTCKDRWRQIINEADRITIKHLFTLQQGISIQQLDEMSDEKVILVVPRIYLNSYPEERRDSIWTLKRFISFVKEKTGI